MKVEQILRELVSINSVSSNSNAEIVSYLEDRLQAIGFTSRRLPYRDERGVEKINLIATAGLQSMSETEVELALVGHTDTVPFDPNWRDALKLTPHDGKLFGRGACDTKGFIAAALAAIESLDLTKLNQPLGLVFTADEEVGCIGAKKLADAKALKPHFSIVGEPTSLQPIRAGKGYCLAEIIVRGREAHSAYPSLGVSANFGAARLIAQIERIAEELKLDAREGFDPPFTSLNVGIIRGGTAKNIIAGECTLTLEWRPIPGQKADKVLDLVREAAEAERKRDKSFDFEIKPLRIDGAMETSAESPVVQFLEEATGKQSGTIAFATEAPQMAELGSEAVVFGPGDIRVAHRTGEFVPVEELHACVGLLKKVIETFCAG